jgi:protein-S-isoprenylcysteine O-methyltransferase Ste14
VGQQLKFKMLVGLPEIAPDKYPKRLLTDGVYARVRHPRYAEVVITVLAWGLVANYLATYVLFAATCAWVLAVVHLEERELRDRFGTQWDEYAARVPRFLPNLHAPPKAASQSAKGQSA